MARELEKEINTPIPEQGPRNKKKQKVKDRRGPNKGPRDEADSKESRAVETSSGSTAHWGPSDRQKALDAKSRVVDYGEAQKLKKAGTHVIWADCQPTNPIPYRKGDKVPSRREVISPDKDHGKLYHEKGIRLKPVGDQEKYSTQKGDYKKNASVCCYANR